MGQRSIDRGSHVDAVAVADQRDWRTGRVSVRGRRRWRLRKPGLRDPRVHHPIGSTRLPDRSQVHQRAARGERAVHRATAAFGPAKRYPRVVRRDDEPGVPAARAGHVRAAGSSERDCVAGAPPTRPAATPAGRSRSDGRPVRSPLEAVTGPFGDRLDVKPTAGTRPPAERSSHSIAARTTRSSRESRGRQERSARTAGSSWRSPTRPRSNADAAGSPSRPRT